MLQLRIISWVIWGQCLNAFREENIDLKSDYTGSSLLCQSAESRPKSRDFPGGLVIKNPPSNGGDGGSIPGWETKIPHAEGQLSSQVATSEPHTPQWEALELQQRLSTAKNKRPKSRRHRETNCGSRVQCATFEAVSCPSTFVCLRLMAAWRTNWRCLNEGLLGDMWVRLRRPGGDSDGEAPGNSLSRTLAPRARKGALVPVPKKYSSVQSLSPVWLCNRMDCSMPGFPVHHLLPELVQTHVHWVSDAIQPFHPPSSPSPAFTTQGEWWSRIGLGSSHRPTSTGAREPGFSPSQISDCPSWQLLSDRSEQPRANREPSGVCLHHHCPGSCPLAPPSLNGIFHS